MATAHGSQLTDIPKVRPAARPRSKALAAVAIGFTLLVELIVLATRTRIATMIDDFELEAPLFTIIAIHWMLPAVLAAVILAAIIKEFLPAPRWVVDGCNVVVFLIGVTYLAIYVVGLAHPLYSLSLALS